MNLAFGFTDTIPTQTKYMYISLDVSADFFFFAGMQQLVDARMVCFYYVVEETPLARHGLNTMSWLMSHQ
ncbi:hypothetical protein Hanom_Chr11g01042391 [Helianthus anomalus]